MPIPRKEQHMADYRQHNRFYDVVRGVANGVKRVETSRILSRKLIGKQIEMAEGFNMCNPVRILDTVTDVQGTTLITQTSMINLGSHVFVYVDEEQRRIHNQEGKPFLVEIFPYPTSLPLIRNSHMSPRDELKEFLTQQSNSEMVISNRVGRIALRKGLFTYPFYLNNQNAWGVKLWTTKAKKGQRKKATMSNAPIKSKTFRRQYSKG